MDNDDDGNSLNSILATAQSLSDLELACLLCLVGEQRCCLIEVEDEGGLDEVEEALHCV